MEITSVENKDAKRQYYVEKKDDKRLYLRVARRLLSRTGEVSLDVR